MATETSTEKSILTLNTIEQLQFQNPIKSTNDTLKSCLESEKYIVLSTDNCTNTVQSAGTWFYTEIALSENYQNFFQEIDNFVKQSIYDNRMEWFQKDIPYNFIEKFYQPSISKNNKIKLKVSHTITNDKQRLVNINFSKIGIFENINIQENTAYESVNTFDQFQNKPLMYVIKLNSLKFMKQKCSLEYSLESIMEYEEDNLDSATVFSSTEDIGTELRDNRINDITEAITGALPIENVTLNGFLSDEEDDNIENNDNENGDDGNDNNNDNDNNDDNNNDNNIDNNDDNEEDDDDVEEVVMPTETENLTNLIKDAENSSKKKKKISISNRERTRLFINEIQQKVEEQLAELVEKQKSLREKMEEFNNLPDTSDNDESDIDLEM